MNVPPELLVPSEAYGRGFCPHDAALVLDGWLRRLAAQDARGRLVLGRLARAFLRRHGHHELGFGRLGDYSRERIGLSARELQSLATVSAHLERLPQLRAAFADGVLSWAQIRLLTAVATPEDEAEWLARAEGRTVRALAAVMHAAGRRGRRRRALSPPLSAARSSPMAGGRRARASHGGERPHPGAGGRGDRGGRPLRAAAVRRGMAGGRAACRYTGRSGRDPGGVRRPRLERHPRRWPARHRR